MASRTKRVTILALSKLLNFAVQFLTPILLVRILDRELYGQYKEFFVYSSLIGSFISFSIKYNLLYFVSKNPKGIKYYVTNTIFLELVTCFIGIIAVKVFEYKLLEATSYNFFYLLVVYLIFTTNFDYLEPYWLSQKKSNHVLYYSLAYSVIRVILILITAYITRDLTSILYTVVIMELLRLLFGIVYAFLEKIFTFKIDKEFLKEQLVYIIPLGLASLLVNFNHEVSKVVISANLGPGALALYAIGTQRVPVIGIIQSSIVDVIFPDMTEKVKDEPNEALNLWKRANILYLYMLVPLFFIQLYYAETIIKVLFTKEYLDSIILFQIYLGFFLLQCFEMGVPIRVKNENKKLLYGHIYYTILHIGVLYLSFQVIGFLGPAIAFLVMELIATFYFATLIIKLYKIKLKELFFWNKVFAIIFVGLISSPIFYLGSMLKLNEIVSLFLFGTIYVFTYLIILSKFHYQETDLLLAKILKKLKLEKIWR